MSGISIYPFRNFMLTAQSGLDDIAALYDIPDRKGDTVVGNDFWIGTDATVLPDARIGDGAIVAARSVVAGDVPPYTIVGGNPARPLRCRYDDETVNCVLSLRWWDWPAEVIEAHVDATSGADLEVLQRVSGHITNSRQD